MNSLKFSCLLLIAFAINSVTTINSSATDLKGSKPNVILVITDDQGFGQLGRHGHPWLKTPSLDSLYDQSLRFNAFFVSPTCAPTRSALMTGHYPFRNGVSHTILERERLTLKTTTIAQALKKAGYRTGIFGKWHLGDEAAYQPENRGFDEVFIHGAGGIGQAYNCSCADVPNNKYFDPVVRHNGKFVKTRGFCTDVFFEGALGWIKEQKKSNDPFFAYITTNAPHGPFLAPDASKKRFLDMQFSNKHAGYYGMVENIDDNVGKLMTYLKKWDMEENTLLIFMSDNGTTAAGAGKGKIGIDADGKAVDSFNAGLRGYKGSISEGGTKVPAFWRWKGKLEAGAEIDQMAAHIDFMPTILELAGVEQSTKYRFDGRSLLPLLEGNHESWKDRMIFFHVGRWKKDSDRQLAKYQRCAVRNQRFRFCNNEVLYDLQNDPGETKDVAEDHPKVVAEMKRAYDKWWDEMQPFFVNDDVPLSKTRPYHIWYKQQLNNGGIPDWNAPKLD